MQRRHPYEGTYLIYLSKGRSFVAMLLMVVILGLGVVGVLSPYDYNVLPAVPVLELVVLLLSVMVCPPKSRVSWLFILMAGAYLAITFGIAYFASHSHILDYMQAYKAFFYVALLCSFIGESLFKKEHMAKFFYLLLALFFLKYGYSRLIGLDAWVSSRPGIFTENNFELLFLILLFYLVLPDIRWKSLSFVTIMLIIFLSGSRSAFLVFLVIYFFSVFRLGRGFIKQWLLLFPLLIVLMYGIVNDRMDISIVGGEGLEGLLSEPSPSVLETSPGSEGGGIRSLLERGASIDRVRFLLYFLDDTEEWRWWNVMLGTQPLTPLSPETCEALSFWNDMYSFSGDGSCYSVILHSYIIRVIFDHGVLGLVFLMSFTVCALRKSGYTWMDTLCVLGALLASSLSVSAFNSVFAMLSMIFYLAQEQREETIDKRHVQLDASHS
ncbi:MAG: hypothetical protein JJT87_14045 [Halomonas sp.]|nr:hypothetical protein [Halomonas sp.]MCC5903030.1 hypothetical protein [Halomonas sp.]